MRALRALTVATALVFPAIVASCASAESDEIFGQPGGQAATGGAAGGGDQGGSSYGGYYSEGGTTSAGGAGNGGAGGIPTTSSSMTTTATNSVSSSSTGGGTCDQTQCLLQCAAMASFGQCMGGQCVCGGFDGGFDLDGGFPDLGFP